MARQRSSGTTTRSPSPARSVSGRRPIASHCSTTLATTANRKIDMKCNVLKRCVIALGLIGCGALRSSAADPLRLVQTILLPGVEGRIDHFAVDAKGQRLFVAALGNNTVEVVDLAA